MDRLDQQQQADSMAHQLADQDDDLLFRDLTKILEDDDDAEAQLQFTNMIEAFDAEHDDFVCSTSPLGPMGADVERSPSDYGSYNGINSCLVSNMPEQQPHQVVAPIEQVPPPTQEVPAPAPVVMEAQRASPTHHYRRRTANARERIRMREINQAFEKLKARVPVELIQQSHDAGELSDQCSESTSTSARTSDKQAKNNNNPESIKLTKINTLRLAVSYISKLSELLNETKQTSSNSNSTKIQQQATQKRETTKEAAKQKARKRAPRKVNSTSRKVKNREKVFKSEEVIEKPLIETPNHHIIKCEQQQQQQHQQVKLTQNYCTSSASASPEPVKQIIVFHLYSNTIAFHQQQMLNQSTSQTLAAANAGAPGGTLQIIRPNYQHQQQQQQPQQQQLCLLNQTHGSQQIICAPQPQQHQQQQQQVVQVQPPPPQQPQLCFVPQQQQQQLNGSHHQQILNNPPAAAIQQQQQETVNQVMASLATSIKSTTTRASSPELQQQQQQQQQQPQQRPPIRQYRFHNYDGNMMMPPINSN